MTNSTFIVFEGVEGSGKSTQARILCNRLGKAGYNVVFTREPGGTKLGDKLRRWVKWGQDVPSTTELFLFLASRSQLVSTVIRPALAKGNIVICDRYTASTLAYQGYGRGINLGFLESMNRFATDGLMPDIVLLFDLNVEAGLKRKMGSWDSFEREEIGFHRRVRDGYLEMADASPNWIRFDASLPKSALSGLVWEHVSEYLGYEADDASA